jgi:hypothetical protein
MRTRAGPASGTAHEISTILHKRRRSFRALLMRCPLAHLIDEACSRLSRNLTRWEWRLYLGDEPYRKTCPNLPEPQ